MSLTFQTETYGNAIIIRYDGLDADRHEIDMALLGESLQGFSKIIGVVGNFAATERIITHKDAFVLKVVVSPPLSHCFEIMAVLKWVNDIPLITTVVGGLTVALVTYVFQKAAGNREEMRQLRGALDTAIRELGHRDQTTVDKLLATIDKMADNLRSAVRQAVIPIGDTASSITIANQNGVPQGVFSAADKEAILSETPTSVGKEDIYSVRFTEMDTETGACKVALDPDAPKRISAKITDPAFWVPNNPYVLALASKAMISVSAKPLIKNGELERLYISNTA